MREEAYGVSGGKNAWGCEGVFCTCKNYGEEGTSLRHALSRKLKGWENVADSIMTREEFGRKVIETATAYANYRWIPTEKNCFHGLDEDGRYVDTPDVTWRGEVLDCGWWKVGKENIGIPYGWGNASTLGDFEEGLRAGKYAGNVPEDKSRYGSHYTVGVDCSGLLSICWKLPKKIATRDIPQYADELESLDELRQGDVFAKVGSHVMLFKEFADETKEWIMIVDATRSTGKVSERKVCVAELIQDGYRMFRKKET